MVPFAIPEPAEAQLFKFSTHTQREGPADVPALSLRLLFSGLPNTILLMIAPELLETLYAPLQEGQEVVPGVDAVRPRLRCPDIGRVSPPKKFEGWLCLIEHGPRDDGAIELARCKVDEFHFDLHDGGKLDMECRVGTAAVEADDVGLLWSLQKHDVWVRFVPPKPGASAAAPAPAAKPAAAAAPAGQASLLEEGDEDADSDEGAIDVALLDRDALGLPADENPQRWLVRLPDGDTLGFDALEEAQAEQRAQRVAHGLDPETGKPEQGSGSEDDAADALAAGARGIDDGLDRSEPLGTVGEELGRPAEPQPGSGAA